MKTNIADSITVVVHSAGRPKAGTGIPWGKAALWWRNFTNKEIQEKFLALGHQVSIVSIFLRRNKMIESGKKVACVKPRYTRVGVTAKNSKKKVVAA